MGNLFPDSRITPQDLAGWLPAEMPWLRPDGLLIWQFGGTVELTDPFYRDTMLRMAAQYPEQPRLGASLLLLKEFLACDDITPLTGFIFHTGRCGSTVVSNALRTLAGSVSISEPEPLINLLLPFEISRWPFTVADWNAQKPELLRGAVAALGRRRFGHERHLFIKFSDWNMSSVAQVRALWPDTPFLFIYRDPLEVVASQLAKPAQWLLFRFLTAAELGQSQENVRKMSLEEYCVRVLGRQMSFIADHLDDGMALLHYREISAPRMLDTFRFFGVDAQEADSELLNAALSEYAKDKREKRAFVPDSAAKRASLATPTRRLVERLAEPAYQELERLRSRYGLSHLPEPVEVPSLEVPPQAGGA